jgi:Ca2+-binding RTX toxin-like protein
MALSLVGIEEVEARPAAAKAIGPSVVASRALVEACAGGGGCDENSAEGWTSSYSDARASSGPGTGSAGDVQVTIQQTAVGMLVKAKGNADVSSNVTDTGANVLVEFDVDVAVGDQPVTVLTTGTLDVSGAPCTNDAATASAGAASDGVQVACPGPGMSLQSTYAAQAGETVTVAASAKVGMALEAGSAGASFDVEFLFSGCTQLGTPGNDTLVGTAGNDVMCGLGGDDTLRGLGGEDRLLGGDGRDVLFGGDNDDTLEPGDTAGELSFGGPGNDLISGGTWQVGGSGRDTLTGNSNANAMYGCGEVDTITGAGGDDQTAGYRPAVSDGDVLSALGLTGQPADVDCSSSPQPDGGDTIFGNDANDAIDGGPGDDVLLGGAGIDHITAGDGAPTDDIVIGGADDDVLEGGGFMFGGSGIDTMTGTDFSNGMYGCGGKDTMKGKDKRDGITGGNPAVPDADVLGALGITAAASELDCSTSAAQDVKDIISGGGGHDRISGGDGDDHIEGDGGDDHVVGGEGDDHLRGGPGRDKLLGGDDRDTIAGNKAFDIMSGEGGRDTLLANDGVKDKVRGGAKKDKAKVDAVDDVTGVERLL